MVITARKDRLHGMMHSSPTQNLSLTDKKLTEHKKGGFNEFNCLYEPGWRGLITDNLRTYGITEDQLSDLIVLIKACCNYEQDKRPK